MLNISNGLSFLRAPLAVLFIIDQPVVRVCLVIAAMITDSIDGYLARITSNTSRFGAILDPLMDKFFVYFTLGILLAEHQIEPWQSAAMISRDFFLCIFALLLVCTKNFNPNYFRSIRWGKISTACQFFVLIALSMKFPVSSTIYLFFILFGCFAFFELLAPLQKEAKKEP